MSYDTAQPYIASYVLFREANKVAFVLRSNTKWMSGYYGLPSGKIEKDESAEAAAIREAQEEAGVTIRSADLQHILTVHRHEPDSFAPEWVDFYFEATKWTGELHNAEPHMHSELVWLDITNLPDNIIPSVAAALQAITAGESYTQYGWEN